MPANHYQQSLALVTRLIQSFPDSVDSNQLQESIKGLLHHALENGEFLLSLTHHDTQENYLISHCLNSAILAVLIGYEMRISEEDLQKLGIAALLHDVGMAALFEKVNRPGKLSPGDFEEVKKHPVYSAKVLETVNADPEIMRAIYEHHERENGSGYPNSLNEGKIHKLASIIAVADVYQALVHPRPYRQQWVPFQAIKEIMRLRQQFNRQALKGLLEVVSVFPVGTIVELNSGALGRVIKTNKKNPMSPQVELFFQPSGVLPEMKIIDLLNSPLNIQRCLSDEEVKAHIKNPIKFRGGE